MRDELFIDKESDHLGTDEKWNTRNRPAHWYGASTEFALETLGLGNARSCLVIGSPIFEAISLREKGWDVTYMDVRTPPPSVGKFVRCDAVENAMPDSFFDSVSTSCVLTHAGTGRYGDCTNREHGDELMLAHIARIMKKGAIAALSFGACATSEKMVRLGNEHRIYTLAEVRRMLEAANLMVMRMKVWSFVKKKWTTGAPTADIYNPDYISVAVSK